MKIQNPFRVALVATLGVGLGIMLLESITTLSTILLYVGTALFLSLGLDPIISWLERQRLPRWAAVLLTVLGVLAIFTGIVVMVVPVIASQVGQLVKVIADLVEKGTFFDDLRNWLETTFPNLRVDLIFEYATDWLQSLDIGSIGESVLAVGASILSAFAGAFIVLILTIYFTASTPSLKAAVYQLVPASRRPRFIDLSEQITDSVGYYVIGQVSLGVANGILSAIFLSIIGAPFPAVLAVIAFFFSLIPLVGTLTGSALIVLACLLPGGLGSPTTALIAAIYYLIYMQIEAYVISPRIMSRAVAVPGAVVVIAALAGGSLLGLLGALIAIPVAASILIIYRQVVIPRQNER
ncbi:putative PurR-regulated permease PerM [Microbacterium endophyticum]|uniref:Putative PurR-regulated permease PerM n=1 Tax=Microbacterium endophyticum TaxID=1526412 RepID=A0A7W4YMG1_9MICO|nr:AI-2E family transporter [Microbacterium endophyticum]MBB2974606.1 putative PurR-regulated permease PerM [Microbacterium endophyticum]NIK36903.1 putative PurR-regulated permease PerM [Microbacterium endophyticum]